MSFESFGWLIWFSSSPIETLTLMERAEGGLENGPDLLMECCLSYEAMRRLSSTCSWLDAWSGGLRLNPKRLYFSECNSLALYVKMMLFLSQAYDAGRLYATLFFMWRRNSQAPGCSRYHLSILCSLRNLLFSRFPSHLGVVARHSLP